MHLRFLYRSMELGAHTLGCSAVLEQLLEIGTRVKSDKLGRMQIPPLQ